MTMAVPPFPSAYTSARLGRIAVDLSGGARLRVLGADLQRARAVRARLRRLDAVAGWEVSVGVTPVSVSAPTVVFFCTARMRSVRSISTVMTFATIITHSSTTIRPVCERGGFGRRPVP